MIEFNREIQENTENYSSNTMRPQERRRFQRVACHIPVQYKSLNKNSSNDIKGGLSKDISAGGVRFVSTYFLPVFSMLNLEISLDSNLHKITAMARVVWVQKLPYNENYVVGLEFVNIEHKDRLKINRFTSEYSPASSSSPRL
ncbi:MAG: PilZ domain-containing protein [Candidatus Omnitrophota bacterium]